MGLISSRLNLDHFSSNRGHSQQDGSGGQVYLLSKDYFSNYFLMGGERFEINDPDYIFGDICDLNFLSKTKPFPLPYKQAQQNLLTVLNAKQKTNTKVSSRISRLPYAFERITGARTTTDAGPNDSGRSNNAHRHASKTHSSTSSICHGCNNKEPSRPLVMLINIRKETLRLVKSSTLCNPDSDFNSLSDSFSCEELTSQVSGSRYANKQSSLSKTSKHVFRSQTSDPHKATSVNSLRDVTNNKEQISDYKSSIKQLDQCAISDQKNLCEYSRLRPNTKEIESENGSLLSTNSSAKSCYRSVKNSGEKLIDPQYPSDSSELDDEDFKDALNDTDLYLNQNDDYDSEENQQQRSLLYQDTTKNNAIGNSSNATNEALSSRNACDLENVYNRSQHEPGSSSDLRDIQPRVQVVVDEKPLNESRVVHDSRSDVGCPSTGSKQSSFSRTTNPTTSNPASNNPMHTSSFANKIYNIEFTFDAEVDCYLKIFYFCTKEVNSDGMNYKSQHSAYKSKVYHYKKGLNQKFEQPEHTFQPHLFDEDLLIYKPVDLNGNYNSNAVFPIVIHCVASQGSTPPQSQSLIATIEKMDDSYAIKPLKQLIFIDGIQYILQDIFGIENKELIKPPPEVSSIKTTIKKRPSYKKISGLREKSYSLQSNLDGHHHQATSTDGSTDRDSINKGSLASIGTSSCFRMSPTSSVSKLHLQRSLENSFECVVCLAEERDTMLLPCRHLCLCGSCAQSLRYQASTCPICRCPFKAALNLRTIQRKKKRSLITSSSVTAIASATISNISPHADFKTEELLTNKDECKHQRPIELKASPSASSS